MSLVATGVAAVMPTTAAATTVYRCGNTYQATPCAHVAAALVDVTDDRTPEQQRDAQSRRLDQTQAAAPNRKPGRTSKAERRRMANSRGGVSGIPVRGGALDDTPLGQADKRKATGRSTSLVPSRIVYTPKRDEKTGR